MHVPSSALSLWIPHNDTLTQEKQQVADLKVKLEVDSENERIAKENSETMRRREDIEGGYGGQEDLEDRYATTCGEH